MAITLPKKIVCCIIFFSSILGQSTAGSKYTLSFYCHVTNSTRAHIIPPVNPNRYGRWGGLVMIDSMLTHGKDPKSTPIGWAQGFYAGDKKGLNDPSALDVVTFSFTSSENNGSTLAILGQNYYKRDVRELAVVGGTGKYRYATGYAEARTHFLDPAAGITIVGVNISFITIA